MNDVFLQSYWGSHATCSEGPSTTFLTRKDVYFWMKTELVEEGLQEKHIISLSYFTSCGRNPSKMLLFQL